MFFSTKAWCLIFISLVSIGHLPRGKRLQELIKQLMRIDFIKNKVQNVFKSFSMD